MMRTSRKPKPGYHLGRSTMRENNNNNNHNYHHHHRNITQPAEFHYCSIHQLHHCIARTTTTTSRVNSNGHRSARPSQTAPVHGECAWLFFSPRNAVQHRNLDYADPPGPPFPSPPTAHSSNDNRSDTSSSSSGSYTLVNNSNTNSNTSRHSSPSSPSSSSAYTSLPFPAPPRVENHEFAVDGDGDVIMTDAPSVPENKEKEDNTNITVRIPIRRRVSLRDILHSFPPPNPHAESAAWDVSWDEAFHPRFPGVAMLEYTDTFGRRGAQPTASTVEQLRRYLAVLEREEAREEVEGYCDPLMREVREWSCWAQGFVTLDPALRRGLTRVFDFANVTISRQRQLAMPADHHCGSPALLWEARYHLFNLLAMVEDAAEFFGVREVIEIPELDWWLGYVGDDADKEGVRGDDGADGGVWGIS